MARSNYKVFLFGESEKGALAAPTQVSNLAELSEQMGNPPDESQGIDYAVQALLAERDLVFFRVREEGFSRDDYFKGVKFLSNQGRGLELSAICMPGVGDREIIEAVGALCHRQRMILILSQRDLYDYLTGSKY